MKTINNKLKDDLLSLKNTIISKKLENNLFNLDAIDTYYSIQGEYIGKMTFADFFIKTDIIAKGLNSIGVKRENIIPVSLPAVPGFTVFLYALNALGALVSVPSPRYMISQPEWYIDETNAETIVIFDKFLLAGLDKIKKTNVKNVIIVSLGDYISKKLNRFRNINDKLHLSKKFTNLQKLESLSSKLYTSKKFITDNREILSSSSINFLSSIELDKIGTNISDSPYTPGDYLNSPFTVFYTSGTTGRPKGSVYTNENYMKMHEYYKTKDVPVSFGDNMYVPMPPAHGTVGQHCFVQPQLNRVTLTVDPEYNKLTFAPNLIKSNAKIVFAPASHLEEACKFGLTKKHVPHLKTIFTGGEYVSRSLVKRVKRWATNVYIGFGATELAGPMATLSNDSINPKNSSGKKLSNDIDIRIIDAITGEVLTEPNKEGLVQIKMIKPMLGYLNTDLSEGLIDKALTAGYFTEDGYSNQGDIGFLSDDNELTVKGREADHFISNNERIYHFNIKDVVDSIVEEDIDKGLPDIIWAWEAISRPIKDGEKTEIMPLVFLELSNITEIEKIELLKKINEGFLKRKASDSIIPFAYNIIDSFSTDNVTDKRDAKMLNSVQGGFYKVENNGTVIKVNISSDGDVSTAN